MLNPAEFPYLAAEGYTPRSPRSPKYNCIAWAAGDNKRWWAPAISYYWPAGVERTNSIDAYITAFAALGFSPCDDSERNQPRFEVGVTRVALYALGGAPKHAARQIDATIWTSKLGQNIDVEHTLRGLEGPTYGKVVTILKRMP